MIIRAKLPEFTLARIKYGCSQRQLARETGLSSAFLSQLENHKRNIRPDAAKKLCTVLGVEFESIFEVLMEE